MGNPRVHALVDEICSMNLLEIADLTELLRKKLGISASPGMYMGETLALHPCMICSCPVTSYSTRAMHQGLAATALLLRTCPE